MKRSAALRIVVSMLLFGAATAHAQPVRIAVGHIRVAVPGRPFGVAFSRDGATLFVALDVAAGKGVLAVFSMRDGLPVLRRRVPLAGSVGAVAVSHDGRMLAVAQQDAGVGVYDVTQLLADAPDAPDPRVAIIATGPGMDAGRGSGTVGVGFSNDDALLLATDEWQARVSVIDVARLRDPARRANALLGAVPSGLAPVGIAFSDDGRSAFVTSEVGPGRFLPADCTGPGGARRAPGIVTVIDLALAVDRPADAVVAATAAGCEAVRVVLDGALAYVSARGDNAVQVLDRTKFASGLSALAAAPNAARVGRIAVGAQPVGLAIAGRLLIVANSHRRSGGGAAEISVVERASGQVLATLPAADFAREVAVSPDGRLAVVGGFQGQALEVLDLEQLLPPR